MDGKDFDLEEAIKEYTDNPFCVDWERIREMTDDELTEFAKERIRSMIEWKKIATYGYEQNPSPMNKLGIEAAENRIVWLEELFHIKREDLDKPVLIRLANKIA